MEAMTMKYAGLDLGTIEATFNKLGGIDGAARFRRGELILVEAEPKLELALETPHRFVVQVNRLFSPKYPEWAQKLMDHELELTGPDEYDLQNTWLRLHPDQKMDSGVSGDAIYVKLKEDGILADCVGFVDLLAIQAGGITIFRKFFKDKAVLGWRSVVQDENGKSRVPALVEVGGEVMIRWFWLGNNFDASHLALRFSFKK